MPSTEALPRFLAFFLSVVFLAVVVPASAHLETGKKATRQSPAKLDDGALLLRIWNARGEDIEAFNEAFLAAVPPRQLSAIIADATDK